MDQNWTLLSPMFVDEQNLISIKTLFQVLSKSPRIKSLSDPTKKMSKSDQSKWATLNITDPADLVYSKIKKAMSDFEPSISFDLEKRPAISNLVSLWLY
jgi:tryptophanyl-tRNA synthetase